MDIENSLVYFIFDRGKDSNKNPGIIKELLNNYSNSKDNGNNMNGLLLLSYPCLEAYMVSCFSDEYKIPFKKSKELKEYIAKNDYHINRITSNNIIKAADMMLTIFKNEIDLDFEEELLDDFHEINVGIFGGEEKYYHLYNYHFLLSLISLSLIDLGLIRCSK